MQEDRRKRVLIIEDEASIGLMVAEILADEGFGVIGPVGNRREALSALEDRQPHGPCSISALRMASVSV